MAGVNLGVLGGTFDPVHNGHLAIAEAARDQANLAEVIFVPAPRPWQKTRRLLTPVADRLEMLRLALREKTGFRISSVDVNRAGATYTIDTIIDLRQEFGSQVSLFFILGWDSLASLPSWKEVPRLVQLCHLLAAPRPGFPRPDLTALEKQVPGISSRVVVMDRPWLDISASAIRDRASRGLSIEGLVPGAVAAYIKERGLYNGDQLAA